MYTTPSRFRKIDSAPRTGKPPEVSRSTASVADDSVRAADEPCSNSGDAGGCRAVSAWRAFAVAGGQLRVASRTIRIPSTALLQC